MKKIYAFTLLFLTHYLGFSQAKNYFVDGSRWVYQTNESFEAVDNDPDIVYDFEQQYLIQGDTTINGVVYKKLFTNVMSTVTTYPNEKEYIGYDSTGGQYLRYDSLTERVFFLDSANASEVLLYDFNLSVGDSLPDAYRDTYYCCYGSIFYNGYSNAVVDSIDTINLFGSPARQFYISQGGVIAAAQAGNYIIEGVGGANGFWFDNPFYEGLSSGGIYSTWLECFQNGDSVLFGYLQYGSCPYLNMPTEVKNLTAQDFSVTIYPNPATNQLTIHTPSFHNEAVMVSVLNVLGQSASPPTPLQGERGDATIYIGGLSAGIYFLQMKSESGSVVKMFVKE